jgi:hypothetical protein
VCITEHFSFYKTVQCNKKLFTYLFNYYYMLYNNQEFPKYVRTAGKITIVTALAGLMVFVVAFIFDFGAKELSKVSAQTATTTLTVLNTPPSFLINPYETIESSTSTPTNSSDVITWEAVATDSNSAPYFLLICGGSATPTAVDGTGLGDVAPFCDPSEIQWGISASTTSGETASVSTTTEEWGTGQFSQVAHWYAWVCDDAAVSARCNLVPEQGDYSTSSSPFNVNNRPVFSATLTNNGPADPSGSITWNSTSTDPDTADGQDEIILVICNSNSDYSTSLNTCPSDFMASTTISILSNAAATYTLPILIRDDVYPAYGYLLDQHGHEAINNPLPSDFFVSNVAPTVTGGDLVLNDGADLTVSELGTETLGFQLDFRIKDANSCMNASGGSEISPTSSKHIISVFRSSQGTTTCDGSAGSYDPNVCYPNGVDESIWNLSCTATSTCASSAQDYMDFTCTFPLWFVADPTDNIGTTPVAFQADNWSFGLAGSDDNFATGTMATTSNAQELISFTGIGIVANEIAYGSVEPGFNTGTLNATSVAQNLGNTGLDQEVRGESMCGTFSPLSLCSLSASSTIGDFNQQFATSGLAYDGAFVLSLSSTTDQEIELNVNQPTTTSTYLEGTTYWGIAVPILITKAGGYTGLNTYTAVVAEAEDW